MLFAGKCIYAGRVLEYPFLRQRCAISVRTAFILAQSQALEVLDLVALDSVQNIVLVCSVVVVMLGKEFVEGYWSEQDRVIFLNRLRVIRRKSFFLLVLLIVFQIVQIK